MYWWWKWRIDVLFALGVVLVFVMMRGPRNTLLHYYLELQMPCCNISLDCLVM